MREKISKTKTGVAVHSEEYKERRRQMALGNPGSFGEKPPMLGKKRSEETKRKISEATKGRKISAESIAKANATKFARGSHRHSEETKRRISETMKTVDVKNSFKQGHTPWNKGKAGFPGISYRKDRNKYQAYVWIDGKRRGVGCFDTVEEARLAQITHKQDLS